MFLQFASGFALCFGSLGLMYLVAGFLGFIKYDIKWERLDDGLLLSISGLGTAIFEECVFRGLLFMGMVIALNYIGVGYLPALIIQAALFSWSHFAWGMYKGEPAVSWKGLGLFFLGSLLGLSVIWTGALYYAIGLHAGAIAAVSLVATFLGGDVEPKWSEIIDNSHPVIGTVLGILTTVILTMIMYGRVESQKKGGE